MKKQPAYFSNEIFWDGTLTFLFKNKSSFGVMNPTLFETTIPLEVIAGVGIAVCFFGIKPVR